MLKLTEPEGKKITLNYKYKEVKNLSKGFRTKSTYEPNQSA